MRQKKKIFITGIAGFIGFHLARKLKSLSCDVVGCDSFNDYYDPNLKQMRAKLLKQEGIGVYPLDITYKDLLEEKLREFAPTHVVHLAAQAGVRYSLNEPQKYVDANITGFLNVLESVRKDPKIKLIFASSSSVYGCNRKIPFSEDDRCDSPSNFYGATKKAGEVMAHAYHHLYGTSMIGLRFFTVYGPYGRPDMAYFSFTKAIAEGRQMDVYGEGKLLRDFTYIDDIVEGIVATLDIEASFEIFNLGNNRPESVLSLIEMIEGFLGKKAIKALKPMQLGEMEATFADISKSQRLLGFNPKMSLKDGMKRFLCWYQEYFQK